MANPVYDIKVTRIPGLGKPVFYVKIVDSDLQSNDGSRRSKDLPARSNDKHFESKAATDSGSTQTWTLTKEMIESR